MTDTASRLLIAFHDGLGEAVTPTANFTPQSGFPLANLANSRLHSRCRGPNGSLTDLQLTWDFGSAIQANVAAIFGGNLTASATRRYRAADNSGFSSGVIESGASLTAAFDTSLGSLLTAVGPGGRSLIYVHPTDFTKRYHRWHVTDTGNPDNFLEFGVARFGMGWQPGIDFDSSWRSADRWIGAPGAQTVLRGHELTLHRLTKAEAYKVATLCRGLLANRRVLVLPRALGSETWLHDALWAVLEDVYERRVVEQSGGKFYTVTLTFREVDE